MSYHAAEDLLTKAVQLRKTTGSSLEDDEAELVTMLRLLEVARALRYYQGVNAINVQRARELAVRCGRRDLLLELAWFEWSTMSTSMRRDESESFAQAYVTLTADDPDPAIRASGHQVQGVVAWQAGRIVEACEHLDREGLARRRTTANVPVPRPAGDAHEPVLDHEPRGPRRSLDRRRLRSIRRSHRRIARRISSGLDRWVRGDHIADARAMVRERALCQSRRSHRSQVPVRVLRRPGAPAPRDPVGVAR